MQRGKNPLPIKSKMADGAQIALNVFNRNNRTADCSIALTFVAWLRYGSAEVGETVEFVGWCI